MAWLLTWLVHGLAIALITRFALRVLPGLSAATRYAMWWAALVLVLTLPIVRGVTTSASVGAAAPAVAAAVAPAVSADDFASTRGPAVESIRAYALPPISLPRVPDWILSIMIGLWLGSAMVGLAQIAYSVQAVRRLKSTCRRMVMPRESDLPMWSAVRDRGRPVRVRASNRVRTAAVLGLTRPVIAVPRGAAAALTPHEIDQVVLHEYAHVQRYDDWTKLLQVLIGAFAGWHPAVRLMMREIDFEREAACDDYVVDVTGAPRAYARCLTKVIEMMPGAGLDLAAVPHAHSSMSQATTRIERLLDRKRPAGRFAVMPAMAGSVTLAVLAFCTVHALPIATDLPRGGESEAIARDGVTLASAQLDDATRAADENANATATANPSGGAEDSSAASERATAPRNGELRIVSASTLPIELPFARFSPLSRLTDTRREAAPPTASAIASSVVGAPTPAPADVAHADSTRVDRAAEVNSSPARLTGGGPQTSGAPAPTAAADHRMARDQRLVIGARRPTSTPDTRNMRAAAAPRAETTFALGPVVAAGDSNAMPEASDSGHIGRAWENTRDATSKAVGVGARAVGSATKTAGDATKTATNVAAAGMKAGGTHTKRAFGRVKRTLASVF